MKGKLFKRFSLITSLIFGTSLLSGCDSRFVVFNPAGPVGREELHLIVLSVILCAIVVIPVFAILFYILFRYRDKPGNKAPYTPNWNDNKILEIIWWGIPIVIIAILGVATAKGTYTLVKPPVSNQQPITIQVTSLDWKWLFTYPGQNIATVNYVNIPAGVPVQFVLTSDAPMNSFWVPQLGGQEYTMPGMAMNLWLQADKPGSYFGSGANFSGKDFAHMQFKVIAQKQSDFNAWASQVEKSNHPLTQSGYDNLAKQGTAPEETFSSIPKDLFSKILQKNGPQIDGNANSMSNMNGMNMGN